MGIRIISYLFNTPAWIEGFIKKTFNFLFIVGNIIKGLLDYLANTSQDQIKKDLKKLEKYNKVGPSVDEYIRKVKKLKRNIKK